LSQQANERESTEAEEPLPRTTSKPSKMERDLIEAALYVSGRPLELKTLGSVIGTRSRKRTRAIAKALAEEYACKGDALEILELADDRFVMQLKPGLVSKVKRLAIRPLLTPGPLRTLSYVAIRQPVVQSQVIAVRGPQAYSHIQTLEEVGLVSTERLGRTKIIRTTDVFADYFNLSRDPKLLKRQILSMFESRLQKDREQQSPAD
jgi:segregation and condensation protein B